MFVTIGMIMTIQQVLRPLFVIIKSFCTHQYIHGFIIYFLIMIFFKCIYFTICFIMGIGFYPRKQEKPRIRWSTYLSILYSLIIWFIYAYILYYTTNLFTWKVLCRSIIGTVVININIFVTIIFLITNFYYQKIFEIIMKRLSAVDDTLEELGTPKMYQNMHMWSLRIIIGWIIYSIVINLCDAIYFVLLFKQTVLQQFLLTNILNHSVHINTFMDLLFIFLLWYIGNRFDKINENMQCLLVKEKNKLRCTRKKLVAVLHRYNYKRTLWTSMHLHLELCRIARQLNLMFGTQMTLEMTAYFMFLTSLCYGMSVILLDEDRYNVAVIVWIDIGCWFFTVSVRLYVVNYICESVKIKANKIEQIVHQLTNILEYADIWKEIYQFTLQAIHHPLKFTGMNLFGFGNNFLRKFCMAIVTYVIIMNQMTIPIK